MAKIFTRSIMSEIVRRANAGEGAEAIAAALGLKVASLRVKCSRLGISLRQCPACRAVSKRSKAGAVESIADDVPLVVMLPRRTLAQLRHGAAKGESAEALAARLLTVIATEGLTRAILDEDATPIRHGHEGPEKKRA
jgi:hypothetical protein